MKITNVENDHFSWSKRKRGEFWMEFGCLKFRKYHDLLWYNEGNGNEWRYFLKAFWRQLRKRKRDINGNKMPMYFEIMVWHIRVCIHV